MDDDITGSLHLLGEADGLIQFVKVVDTLSVDRSRKRDNRETPLNKTSSVCWNSMKLHIIEFEFKNLAIEISRKTVSLNRLIRAFYATRLIQKNSF